MTLLSNWELWTCAQHYVSRHGADAAVVSAMRCDELFEAGDYEGSRNYQAIIRRINELLEPASSPLH